MQRIKQVVKLDVVFVGAAQLRRANIILNERRSNDV